jgi:hypothetical protein
MATVIMAVCAVLTVACAGFSLHYALMVRRYRINAERRAEAAEAKAYWNGARPL